MLIQCTKKLLDELKVKPELEVEAPPLFSWHANFLTLKRRKTIVFVHDISRYVIVLHGLKAKDIGKLDKLFAEAIREVFLAEGMKEEVIDQYLQQAGSMNYTKTKDRTCVARLNRACEEVSFLEDRLETTSLIDTKISMRLSRFLVGNGKKDYVYPNEEMYKALETFYGQTIFIGRAVQLKVSLRLGKEDAWRRLVVPLNKNFLYLHKVLQVAFDWSQSHLHEFYIDSQNSEIKPAMDSELEEYFTTYHHMKYIYDFGDHWEHDIEVEKIVDDHPFNYAICIDGSGSTPPEDVGGIGGYEAFLEIMADPSHPEHRDMAHWGRMQGYREFDLDQINRALDNSW